MKSALARTWLLRLIDERMAFGRPFLSVGLLESCHRKLVQGERLLASEARALADQVVGDYIGEETGHEFEGLIDWLMDPANHAS